MTNKQKLITPANVIVMLIISKSKFNSLKKFESNDIEMSEYLI